MTVLERKCLENLLSHPWEKIVVQGGAFEETSYPGVYLLSGLWIYLNSQWIEMSAYEEGDDDTFFIEMSELEIPPIPEPSKVNDPPRKRVSNFPEDCRLDQFRERGPTNISLKFYKKSDVGFLYYSPLIIRQENKTGYVITASENVLGALEIRKL